MVDTLIWTDIKLIKYYTEASSSLKLSDTVLCDLVLYSQQIW